MNASATPSQRGKRRRWPSVLGAMVCLAVVATAAWHGFWRYHLKRFEVVEPGVLYRTAQPTEWGIRHLVQRHGVRTILNVRLEDPVLYRGWLDLGRADGQRESQFVPALGCRHIQWPFGDEAYWPWITPWQYEEFFRLFDNPANLPVALHCMGGRHRTGTLVALYELEYQHKDVEQVLANMFSFDFGPPAWIQEHNLRTYLPRFQPTSEELASLNRHLLPGGDASAAPVVYDELVRRLQAAGDDPVTQRRLIEYIDRDRPFALQLAQRLIDSPESPLAGVAARRAMLCLRDGDRSNTSSTRQRVHLPHAMHSLARRASSDSTVGVQALACSPPLPAKAGTPTDRSGSSSPVVHDRSGQDELTRAGVSDFEAWAAAAALVADYGTPDQQQELYRLLEEESRSGEPSPRYRAIVAGVTNRYTLNRVAYLKPILDDARPRPESAASAYRYCDTAVARLVSIIDQPLLLESEPSRAAWDRGVAAARTWFAAHPREAQLARYTPPLPRRELREERAEGFDPRGRFQR